ncbi:MAG: triose-phosphate isomerase [Anaerolineales bacterium]
MRKPIVAGNWKMNKTIAETRSLITDLLPGLQGIASIERVLCPPFTALLAASAMLAGSPIGLGAQNLHWQASGAYTGEVSPQMVAELCQYVIIGHSERRAYFGETDESVNLKVKAALAAGLIPIVCVGETLEENRAGATAHVVETQLRGGLRDIALTDGAGLVIAYEPVWAIGTGLACNPADAQHVIGEVTRPILADLLGLHIAAQIRIQYGGSVNAKNAAEYFSLPDVDGALVGGASLKAAEFIQICQAAA